MLLVFSVLERKEGIEMDTRLKGLMLILAILYVLSPVDFWPGFIDDFIVLMFFSMAAQNRNEQVD